MTVVNPTDVMVKGTAFTSTLRFLEERHGAEGLAKVLAALPEADRTLVTSGISDRRFHPFRILKEMMQISKRTHGEGDQYYMEMGGASTDYAMTVFLKTLFKVASPEFVINQAAVFYGSFYNSGRVRTLGANNGGCTLLIDRFADPCPEFCQRVHGWCNRIVQLAGAKNLASVKTACTCKGDPACRVEATWTT